MDEGFDIPVSWKDSELLLPARLVTRGYTYTIEVTINGHTVNFERDEEGAWRALVSPEEVYQNKDLSPALLSATAEAIEEILK